MASDNNDTDEHPFHRRLREFVARNPSPRYPQINRENCPPDQIEAQMQSSGHRTWGFVIYRSTYGNDAEWEEFIRRVRWYTEDGLATFNGQDIFELMTWTIFDDQSLFDGASTAAIRQNFKQWAQTAVQVEQEDGGNGNDSTSLGWSPRYHYCVQADEESLRSVLQGAAPPAIDGRDRGWVKVIEKDWLPVRENPAYQRPGLQIDDTVYEPIEGVTEEHVGWVKCPMAGAMTTYYINFQNRNGYTIAEERPPAIIGGSLRRRI